MIPKGLFGALARRPSHIRDGFSGLASLTPRRWWTKAPFVPRPDGGWLGFRMESAYGDKSASAPADDALAYLAWRRRYLGSRWRARRGRAR